MTGHDDGEQDDPQLQSLRAAWLAMPDEDPPERGLAELMAAARVKAAEMATPTLWQRITAMLRRPPVLALATVMVLIGGAVLISGQEKTMEVEAPTARLEHAPVQVAPPPAEDLASGQEPAMTLGPSGGGAEVVAPAGVAGAEPAGAAGAEPAKAPVIVDTKAAAPSREKVSDRTETRAPVMRDQVTRRPSAPPRAVSKTPAAEPVAPKRERAELGLRSDLPADGFAAPPPTSAPPSVAASESVAPSDASGANASSLAGDSDDRAAVTSTGATSSRAPQYVAQARTAAARGDCAAARTLMKRVAKEDATAYRKALASDPALSKCIVVAQ